MVSLSFSACRLLVQFIFGFTKASPAIFHLTFCTSSSVFYTAFGFFLCRVYLA